MLNSVIQSDPLVIAFALAFAMLALSTLAAIPVTLAYLAIEAARAPRAYPRAYRGRGSRR